MSRCMTSILQSSFIHHCRSAALRSGCHYLRALFAVLLSTVFIGHAVQAQEPTLILTTEDYPSFNIINPDTQEINGISTEKLIELMHRAGERITINAYPWARSYQMGQKDPNTCVFSTTRTPQRENLFKWVGPLVKNNWVIFARADDKRRPKKLDDLRSYVIGAYRKGAVSEYLTYNGFNIDIANYDAENPRKLLYGRFDFWATGGRLGLTLIKNQGLTGKIVPLFQFNQVELYLACNPAIEQSRIDRFNHILREMEKDGTVAAIENKYK